MLKTKLIINKSYKIAKNAQWKNVKFIKDNSQMNKKKTNEYFVYFKSKF